MICIFSVGNFHVLDTELNDKETEIDAGGKLVLATIERTGKNCEEL